MNLGARLYAYTNNDTYADWVQSSWHWMESVGLISDTYDVHDGSGVDKNCTAITGTRWSYNAGVVLHTAAVMWNKTHDEIWKHRLGGVWNASSAAFFNKDLVMFEQACENSGNNGNGNCDTDQLRCVQTLSWHAFGNADVFTVSRHTTPTPSRKASSSHRGYLTSLNHSSQLPEKLPQLNVPAVTLARIAAPNGRTMASGTEPQAWDSK